MGSSLCTKERHPTDVEMWFSSYGPSLIFFPARHGSALLCQLLRRAVRVSLC